MPENNDWGVFEIKVTAIDKSFASVDDVFVLNVIEYNYTPKVALSIPYQTAIQDQSFIFTFDEITFYVEKKYQEFIFIFLNILIMKKSKS